MGVRNSLPFHCWINPNTSYIISVHTTELVNNWFIISVFPYDFVIAMTNETSWQTAEKELLFRQELPPSTRLYFCTSIIAATCADWLVLVLVLVEFINSGNTHNLNCSLLQVPHCRSAGIFTSPRHHAACTQTQLRRRTTLTWIMYTMVFSFLTCSGK